MDFDSKTVLVLFFALRRLESDGYKFIEYCKVSTNVIELKGSGVALQRSITDRACWLRLSWNENQMLVEIFQVLVRNNVGDVVQTCGLSYSLKKEYSL